MRRVETVSSFGHQRVGSNGRPMGHQRTGSAGRAGDHMGEEPPHSALNPPLTMGQIVRLVADIQLLESKVNSSVTCVLLDGSYIMLLYVSIF